MARDKGKITRFIDRLEASGFVRRASNPRDHRSQIIKPTPQGQRAVPELRRTFEQVQEEFLAGIQSEDLNRLASVLAALLENAGRLYKGKVLRHLQRT
jgi:DNA-binding MarR family transcriptional regulator